MSVPFKNKEFTFTQPDGTRFRVRGSGDQHQAFFETLEGYPVVQDQTSGFYHLAEVRESGATLMQTPFRANVGDPSRLGVARGARPQPGLVRESVFTTGLARTPSRWQVRRAQRRMMMSATGLMTAPPQRKTVGNFVGLCLLVQFPDVAGTIAQSEVEAFCNKQGYKGFGNNGSVRDYFYDVSDGKLTYTSVVAPYYTARNERAYYTNPKVRQPQRARELIREALAFHLGKGGIKFDQASVDGEQYIYALNVFYAGPCVNNWSQGLWPHSFHLETKLALAPNKFAYDYQITDMGSELTLGTFCHENGHMICDFPDLYDYDEKSNGIGDYCLMCGSGNDSPKNPPQIGAYLKHSAGWTSNLYRAETAGPITLRAGKNDFALREKSRTEYFILENRLRANRDASLPDQGLAIWHVDELGSNSDEQMTGAKHYECSLVQADGRYDLEHGLNMGDDGDLYKAGGAFSDTTTPAAKWWDQSASGFSLANVTKPGPRVSFEIGASPKASSKASAKQRRRKTAKKRASKQPTRRRRS